MRTYSSTLSAPVLQRGVVGLFCLFVQQVGAQTPDRVSLADEKAWIAPPLVTVTAPLRPYRQFDRVEITGSAVLAKEAKAALPLQILDRNDIQRSGATELSALLQQLPVMDNFLERGGLAGTSAGGPEAVSIHGNQSGTLVLLNGRRLPYYGSQTVYGERAVVDLNFIPLAAVEKVEILTDGSSSRYGSDAVAGVINIVTRQQQKGVVMSAEKWTPQGQGGQGQMASLLWGVGQLDREGYSVMGALSLRQQSALMGADRVVASEGAPPFAIQGQTWWRASPNIARYSAPGRNYWNAEGQLRNDTLSSTGVCGAGWYEISHGECWRNIQPYQTIYPSEDKAQIFVRAERAFDNQWQASAEWVSSQYTQRYRETFPLLGESYPYMSYDDDQQRTYLMTGTPWGPLERQNDNRLYRGVLGLKGPWGDWDVSAQFSSGTHTVHRVYSNGVPAAGFAGIPSAEIFTDPSRYSAATLAEFGRSRQRQDRLIDDGSTRLDHYGLVASRVVADTDEGPVALGLGLDYRREYVDYTPGPEEAGRQAFGARRSIWAGFTELQLPVAADMELLLALRRDRYSDFGEVTTGKLGWKWSPAAGWLLRSSWGSGFRAPTLAQMVPVQQQYVGTVDPALGQISVRSQGNPALQPEHSRQAMLGARYEPSQRWSLGADLWDLQLHSTFGTLDPQVVFADPTLSQQYWDPNTRILLLRNLNLGQSRSRGIDYDWQWRQPLDDGRLRWTFRGTHMLRSERQLAPGLPMVSNLAVYQGSGDGSGSVVARNQWLTTLQFERNSWSVGASWRYRSGNWETFDVKNLDGQVMPYTHRVAGYGTADVFAKIQLAKNTSLMLRVNNVANRMPAYRGITNNVFNGIDTRYGAYDGRTVVLRLEHRAF